MKVLLINGSPNAHGSTYEALNVIKNKFSELEIDSEIVHVGNGATLDCIGCGFCNSHGMCFHDDVVNEIGELLKTCDGIIVASPTYYAHPSGRILSILDRLSTAYGEYLSFKPASSVMVARRGGNVAGLEAINKHFSINNMPIISSTYWNIVYAKQPVEIKFDLEGVNTLENLALNMAYELRLIQLGKQNGVFPPKLKKEWTNFHH